MSLPDRWFRTRPDSSVLDRPRLLARSLFDVAHLDAHIAFYERLLGVPADLRMPIPDFGGLELAAVGNLLLIASARPFTPIQLRTSFSLIVPSLAAQLARLPAMGTTILEAREAILPGSRARVCYPDGAVAELVEHRPQPGEVPVHTPPASNGGGLRLLARRVVRCAELEQAVRFYEAALECPWDLRAVLDAPEAREVVRVGSLLLVGSDEPEPGDGRRISFALAGRDEDFAAGNRSLVTLGTGARAEVWSWPWPVQLGPHPLPSAPLVRK